MPAGKLYLTRSVIIAIVVHVVVFTLFVVGFQMKPKPSQAPVDPVNIVQAEVIDGAAIEIEKSKKREQKAERERKKREEELRKKKQKEEQKRREEEARKQAEEQRQAELKKAEEEKQQAEAAKKKAEQERKQAEEAKKKAEEAKKQAELERKQAEEKAKKLAEKLKKQEEAKKKAEQEAEQRRLEAILEREEAELREAEEQAARAARQRELNTLLSQYIGAISSKVQSRWRRPPGMEATNAYCIVHVFQTQGGYIEDVQVKECRGGDEKFRRSVEQAVWKSDPLPTPSDDELFDRELRFKFQPQWKNLTQLFLNI